MTDAVGGLGDIFTGAANTVSDFVSGGGGSDILYGDSGAVADDLLFGGSSGLYNIGDIDPLSFMTPEGDYVAMNMIPDLYDGSGAASSNLYGFAQDWGFDPSSFSLDTTGTGALPSVSVGQAANQLASRLSTGAALQAGTSVIGGLLGANAARQAAKIQSGAADRAASSQMQMYNQTRADLLPWQAAGLKGTNVLTDYMGMGLGQDPNASRLLGQFDPTMAELEQTPGYQFTLDQGLKAAQNAYSAKGLGSSGAATRGAVDYATGLASTTYSQRLQEELSKRQQIYNMLQGIAGSGQNAAAQLGSLGTAGQAQAGQFSTSGGAAQAAGQIGTASALAGGLGGAANAWYGGQLAGGMLDSNQRMMNMLLQRGAVA